MQTFMSDKQLKDFVSNNEQFQGIDNLKGMEVSKGKIKQTFILQDEFDSEDNLSVLIENNFNGARFDFKILSV